MFSLSRTLRAACSLAVLAALSTVPGAWASGPLPDSTLVLLPEAKGQAQIGVTNTDAAPLLLRTRVVDVPGSNAPAVLVLPPFARLEPGARQIVRFVLDGSQSPSRVQQLKRVIFEGIPSKAPQGEKSVQVGLAQNLPMIISPAGLAMDEQPWKKLVFSVEGSRLRVRNPSPYVVRVHADALLLPGDVQVPLFPNSHILPGGDLSAPLPAGANIAAATGVRIHPASLWGGPLNTYDATLSLPAVQHE